MSNRITKLLLQDELYSIVYDDTAILNRLDNIENSISNIENNIDGINGSIGTINNNISSINTNKANKASTLAGYGITNAYTKTEVDNGFVSTNQFKVIQGFGRFGHLESGTKNTLHIYSMGSTYVSFLIFGHISGVTVGLIVACSMISTQPQITNFGNVLDITVTKENNTDLYIDFNSIYVNINMLSSVGGLYEWVTR